MRNKLSAVILAAAVIVMLSAAGIYIWKEVISDQSVYSEVEADLSREETGAVPSEAAESTEDSGDRIEDTETLEAETTESQTPIRMEIALETTTAEETPAETEPELPENCTLLFGGDVYLSNHVLNAYDQAGGIHGVLDEGIRAEIETADIFMVNQEFPFTERGTQAADKQYTFRLPHDRVHLMNEMGIDIVTMANNHILDFGREGITDSIAALNDAGIRYVGVGENLDEAKKLEIIEVGGRKIGFLGLSRVYMSADWAATANRSGVFSTYDPTLPLEEIKKADALVDYLVVYVHWGVERETTPKEYQQVMGRQYIDAGADLVIGSHPHVLQPIEYYNGKPIVYSLGNFVFGSSIPSTELVKIVLDENGEITLTEIPCTSSGGYTRMVQQ